MNSADNSGAIHSNTQKTKMDLVRRSVLANFSILRIFLIAQNEGVEQNANLDHMQKLSSNVLTSRSPESSSSRMKDEPDFMTVKDWAERLQVSKRTIFRMIDEKVIPAYDIAVGKTRRWHRATYEKWVAEQVEKKG